MLIGIDATCWWSRRGFGRFTRELLKAMFALRSEHHFCLFVDRAPEMEMVHPHVKVVQLNPSSLVTVAANASGSRSLRDVWAFTEAASREPLDLMFFPAVYSWFPIRPGIPVVVTMHDAIAEHFPELIFPNRKGRLFWNLKMRLARAQASRILTVSNAAKEEIIAHLGVRADVIDVVTEAADARFIPSTDEIAQSEARLRVKLPLACRFIIYVGGLAPHKNISGLLDGFAMAADKPGMEDIHIALVGDPGGDGFHSNYDTLLQKVKNDPRLHARVHFTGYVSDEDLVLLYSSALAVALASFSEGFGLPAIEAMSCGLPVLASTAGSIPEVVGDAGIYFDPSNVNQIADAIYQVATDRHVVADLREKALARSSQFTWQNAARLTIDHLAAARRGA